MIYVSKDESIIKIDGTRAECESDLYNILKCCIRSGILTNEILKIVLAAALAVVEESDEHDPGE